MSLNVYHQSKVALGSDVTVLVVTKRGRATVEDYLDEVWQRIFMFERRFSRFLPQSELSQFNQKAGIRQMISEEFQDILHCSDRLSYETSGLYNPFVLPVLQKVGYVGSFVGDYGNEPEINFSDRSLATAEKLQVGDGWAEIPYGTAIDLGGCGKGYLGDLLAAENIPEWVSGFWFSFGGDVVGGGLDESNQPWTVEIKDALDIGSSPIGQFVNMNSTFHIATSSVKERRGGNGGNRWHHIIDPRTREPARTDVAVATIASDSLVKADVLATCSIILGSGGAPEFLSTHGVESAVLAMQYGTSAPTYRSYGKSMRVYDKVSEAKL